MKPIYAQNLSSKFEKENVTLQTKLRNIEETLKKLDNPEFLIKNDQLVNKNSINLIEDEEEKSSLKFSFFQKNPSKNNLTKKLVDSNIFPPYANDKIDVNQNNSIIKGNIYKKGIKSIRENKKLIQRMDIVQKRLKHNPINSLQCETSSDEDKDHKLENLPNFCLNNFYSSQKIYNIDSNINIQDYSEHNESLNQILFHTFHNNKMNDKVKFFSFKEKNYELNKNNNNNEAELFEDELSELL